MSLTITISAELERRIGMLAEAQGKNPQQITIEALQMVFDPNELEDARTLRALESARKSEGRPAKDVLEEIRIMLGISAEAVRAVQ